MGKRLFKILWVLLFSWSALCFLGTVSMAFSEIDEHDFFTQLMRQHRLHGTLLLSDPETKEFEDEYSKRIFSDQSMSLLLTKRQILDFVVYALTPIGVLMVLQYIVLGTLNPRSSFRRQRSPE